MDKYQSNMTLHIIYATKQPPYAQQQKHSTDHSWSGQIKIITYELIKFNPDYVNVMNITKSS